MLFTFKQKSQDFYVSENLPFTLSWKGDAFYVQIEKRNMTTYDIIDHLRKRLKISRMTLGIAGLKDKKAIARQRISIYDRALKKLGGEKVFVHALEEICTILDTWRHQFPLNMSTPITNSFSIRLRSTKNLGKEEKLLAEQQVKKLLDSWYPNAFWEQRFGIKWRNAKQGHELFMWTSHEKFKGSDAIFKLQAFGSQLFNNYVTLRKKQHGKIILDGDILVWTDKGKLMYWIYNKETNMVSLCSVKQTSISKGKKSQRSSRWTAFVWDVFFTPTGKWTPISYDSERMIPTWPIPGINLPVTSWETESWMFEAEFLARHHLDQTNMWAFTKYVVYGLRRALWVTPSKKKARFDGDDLVVNFTLPSGSYASILVDMLLWR